MDEWEPNFLDRVAGMENWMGNYSIREELPNASEEELSRIAAERWYRERSNRLFERFVSLVTWCAWISTAGFIASGVFWHEGIEVAIAILSGWFLLLLVLMGSSPSVALEKVHSASSATRFGVSASKARARGQCVSRSGLSSIRA